MQARHAYLSKPNAMHWSSTTSNASSPSRSVLGGSGVSTAPSSRMSHEHEGTHRTALPPYRQQEILDQVNETVTHVLTSMLVDRKAVSNWLLKGEKNGVELYVDTSAPANQYHVCFMSETPTPVEHLMKPFVATDSDALVQNQRIIFKNVLYARILDVLSYPAATDPYKSVTLSYSCFETPKLVHNRDLCVAMSTDIFTHIDGSKVGYCLWDSIEHPACPDYAKSYGIVRSNMSRSGFVFRSTTDGYETTTKIVYLVGMELGNLASRLATKRAVDKYGRHVTRLCGYVRQNQLDASTFMPRGEWTPKSDAKFCKACIKKFSTLSVKNNCAACGEIVCKSCHRRQSVDVPGIGIKSMRVCYPCLEARGVDCDRLESPKSLFSTRESRRRVLHSLHSVSGPSNR